MVSIEIQTQPTPPTSPELDDAELSCDSETEDLDLAPAQTEAQKNELRRAAFEDFISSDAGIKGALAKADELKRTAESHRIIDQARDYQLELFELAKESNVIAVLDTGSGKTLIACLLMRWMAQRELIDRASKGLPRLAFFLVNSVHLVRQQSRVLTSNLAETPAVLHGGSKNDLSRAGWRKIVQNHTAVVCTAEMLNQSLSRSYINIREISLLIFDEAHHTKKGHPYARIIIDHYMPIDRDHRPKIFGMTASPLHTTGDVRKAIQTLETFLHSKVVTTPDMTILAHAPKAKNEEWEYCRLGQPFETDLYRKLLELCYIEELREYFEFAKDASSQLGPWMADQIWRHTLGSEREATKTIQRFEQNQGYKALGSATLKEQAIRRIQSASQVVKQQPFQPPTRSLECLSPKTLLLFQRLSTKYSEDTSTRSIIFVERRLTAQMLADCFRQLNIRNLRPGVLLGVNKSGPAIDDIENTSKKQEKIMEHFRAGLINCVFATNVAEEGIDVPQCSLVIRFDLFKTPIQYMQSKGRARMKDSVYAMMVEQGNRTQRDNIRYAVEMEIYIKDVCNELPRGQLIGTGSSIIAQMKAREARKTSFETSSNAVCNYGNSRSILASYANSLRYDDATHSEPMFELFIKEDATEDKFRFKVTLLECSESRTAWGEPCRSKSLARSSAAWSLCHELRKKGLLDENLNSVHVRKRPENANAHIAVSETKHKYGMKVKPDLWNHGLGSMPETMYATFIHLVPTRELDRRQGSLILFTRQLLPAIPSFKVYLGSENVQTDVVLQRFTIPMNISEKHLQMLTDYTLDGIFSDVFNKTYHKDSNQMSYWLAPASLGRNVAKSLSSTHILSFTDDLIDLESLKAVQHGRMPWTPGTSADTWCNRFLVDPRNGKYHYFTHGVVEGATMESPVPETAKEVPNKGKQSVIDWTDSLWKQSKKLFAHMRDPEQPVLSADLIMIRRNFLEPSKEKSSSISCYVCPQPLECSPLEPSHAATALVWPAILHRLEAYLITQEAFQKLDIEVPAELSLEAFTKDSNTDDSENQIHSGTLRGMGKNYERLEFIGDSLLKMTTTIMVYTKYGFDEFSLHVARMNMLSNLNLFTVATGPLELFRYARISSFNRETWYPENLVLLKGRGVKNPPEVVKHTDITHDLGQKTIADISEAIIGAALMASQVQPPSTKFDAAINAVTQLVSSKDHDISKWSDILPKYKAPKWSLLQDDPIANDMASKVYRRTGYKFKNPRLLRSAMTHSSDQLSVVPDLQRLEFLGDAILDMVCINWMFDKYPDRNPQWLTEHKMAMVSNKFLAALAIDLDFDKVMVATSPAVMSQVFTYALKVRETLLKGKKSIREDFWVDISSPPKSLSDLVESYIGAVLIDSDFNYSQIEKFFDKHILWYFKSIEMYDSFANRHPTSYIHRRLTGEYGCLDYKILCSEPVMGDAEVSITAGILIHNKVVASSKGTSSNYAKVRASKQCLDLLNGVTIGEFRERFGCDCRRGEIVSEPVVEDEGEGDL